MASDLLRRIYLEWKLNETWRLRLFESASPERYHQIAFLRFISKQVPNHGRDIQIWPSSHTFVYEFHKYLVSKLCIMRDSWKILVPSGDKVNGHVARYLATHVWTT